MNPQNSSTPSSLAGTTAGPGQGSESSHALADTKNQIATTAREAAAKVKEVATNTAAKAKDQAAHYASEKKEEAAGRLGGYSSAIHDSARSLEEKDPNIAWFTHRAADKLQGVADYMRGRDLGGLRTDAEGIARRHPAAFFGGMFLAGLILGNVVKASRRKLDAAPDHDDLRGDDHDANAPADFDSQREFSAAERDVAGI